MTSHVKSNRLPLLMVMIVFILIQFALYQLTSVSKERDLFGTDSYMRLVRVEALIETGNWYDTTIERSNAPYGEQLHWSRAMDILIIGLASAIGLFVESSRALLLAGIWISPLLGCLALLSLPWVFKPIVSSEGMPLLLLIVQFQPGILQLFSFGIPDHHSLIALVFLLTMGSMFRVIMGPSDARGTVNAKGEMLLGFFMAVGMWISVESLVMVILVLGILSVRWMILGREYLRMNCRLVLSVALFSLAFLFVETPVSMLFNVVYDKLSIVHIVFFFIVAAIFTVTELIQRLGFERQKMGFTQVKLRLIRLGILSSMGILGAFAMAICFPGFLHGPFADVNPEIKALWLSKVSEVQPLLNFSRRGISQLIFFMGLPIASNLAFLLIARKDRAESPWKYFAISGSVLYILLSLYQVRWTGFAVLMSVPAIEQAVLWARDRMNSISSELLAAGARISVTLLILIGFTVVGGGLMATENKAITSEDRSDLKQVTQWINDNQDRFDADSTMLAFMDFGPELLYRTDLNVIGTPYHRNDEGILFSYDVMNATNEQAIRSNLESRGVDLILIAPLSSEDYFYNYTAGNGTFYDLLRTKKTYEWLDQVSLPQELSDFKLFVVAGKP